MNHLVIDEFSISFPSVLSCFQCIFEVIILRPVESIPLRFQHLVEREQMR